MNRGVNAVAEAVASKVEDWPRAHRFLPVRSNHEKMLTKNIVPNLIALALIGVSFLAPSPYQAILLSTGMFALSGALTNWLAVHMLFERIPGLYGSGVITLHFEEFKEGILRLVHEELFNPDKVDSLFKVNDKPTADGKESPMQDMDFAPLLKSIDLDSAYDQLVATILDSSFGSMLAMVGGEAALEPMREPFKKRMESFLNDAAKSPRLQSAIQEQLSSAASSERFVARLDLILRARLDELTPEMVRDIMQRMIRRHLGWLVVWGGIFGGLIGFIAAIAGIM